MLSAIVGVLASKSIAPSTIGQISVTNPDYYFMPSVFSWMSSERPDLTADPSTVYFADITPAGGTVIGGAFSTIYELQSSSSFRLGPQLSPPPGRYYVIEFEIILDPEVGNDYFLGWWSDGFGPPFQSSLADPGATAFWKINNLTSSITFYGGSPVDPETSIAAGDKIQIAMAGPDIYFFKNQSFIASGSTGNSTGYFFIGFGI